MKRTPRRALLLAAAIVLGPKLLVTELPAGSASGCLYQCETSVCADFSNQTGYCQQVRARCQAHCSQPNAYQAWGAIAYSKKDKAYGSSWNQDTKAEATKMAMDNCIKHGSNCVLWIYFNKECGAIAVDGNFAGWGTANARYYAKQRAIEECTSNGGRSCYVLDSVCSQ